MATFSRSSAGMLHMGIALVFIVFGSFQHFDARELWGNKPTFFVKQYWYFPGVDASLFIEASKHFYRTYLLRRDLFKKRLNRMLVTWNLLLSTSLFNRE